MNTKTITRRGREWLWPEYDTELIKVFDQVDDIDTIMQYVPEDRRRVCVQAGGACGVWPARFCELFDTVYTFEPDPLNYECAVVNAPDAFICWTALGANTGQVSVHRHESEATNAGAGYTLSNGGALQTTIDLFMSDHDSACDLIQLDVEGAELLVLHGAGETLLKFQPTVVIEEKPLPQGGDHLAARRLLESWGYKEAARIHRDVVFVHD